MAKKSRTLDTPFRKGEKVQTTREIDDVPEGATGKIKLSNGLGSWRRYWVLFEDGEIRGQISHDELVRPSQLEDWLKRKEDEENAALASADAVTEVAAETSDTNGDGGLAALVPPHILERSKAAKARLTG